MPKIFSPDQPVKRIHALIPNSDWDDLAELAKKADMTTGGLIRAILQTFLKHSKDQARRAVDEVEREFDSSSLQINIPNLEEIKKQAKQEQQAEVDKDQN